MFSSYMIGVNNSTGLFLEIVSAETIRRKNGMV